MATTPQGLPYPLGTDRVVDGDNAIRALAEAVSSYMPVLNARQTAQQTLAGAWALMSTALPVAAGAERNKITWAAAAATIQTAGLYRVTVNLRMVANSTVLAVQATVNSSAADVGVCAYDYQNNQQHVSGTGIVRLAVGDVVRMFGYGSAQTQNTPTGCMFTIEWVRQ
jgi:hypothetical protein